MKIILLDTSSLLYAARNRLDLLTELRRSCDFPIRPAVLEGVIDELRKLTRRGKERRAALLALALLKARKISLIPKRWAAEKTTVETIGVDDLLVNCSKAGQLVLTQDKELKERLFKPYLTIRQGKKIIVVR